MVRFMDAKTILKPAVKELVIITIKNINELNINFLFIILFNKINSGFGDTSVSTMNSFTKGIRLSAIEFIRNYPQNFQKNKKRGLKLRGC